MGTRRWVSPGKTYFEIKTLNICHRFSWPQRLFCGSYCRKVHAILCTWSIWALCGLFKVVFHRYTFSSSVFYSCSHVHCVLSKQELLLQFLSSLKHFVLLVPAVICFKFSRISIFRLIFWSTLYSTNDRVRHGGNWGPGPIHITLGTALPTNVGSFHQGCKFIESRNFSAKGTSGPGLIPVHATE